jgi:hypothetical protein
MRSNSSATSPSFSERTSARSGGQAGPAVGRSAVGRAIAARGLHARVLPRALVDLAREDHGRGRRAADDRGVGPSSAATSMLSLSVFENTTKAPPW